MLRKKDKKIVSEVLSEFLNENCMLNEYKNPTDAESIRAYTDGLQQIRDRIVEGGCSKHEITIVLFDKIIKELRHLENMMKM